MKRTLKSLMIILTSAVILSATPQLASAAIFSTVSHGISATSDDSTCNPSQDWCVDIRPDNTIQDWTTGVSGTVYGDTVGHGTFNNPYGTDLEHSNLPFYNGVWLTPANAKKYSVTKIGIVLNKITNDKSGKTYPLTNCDVSTSLSNYKILQRGIVRVLISKIAPGNYRCTITPNVG